jgi:hypothetical protein
MMLIFFIKLINVKIVYRVKAINGNEDTTSSIYIFFFYIQSKLYPHEYNSLILGVFIIKYTYIGIYKL